MLIREFDNGTAFADLVGEGSWSFASRGDDESTDINYQVNVERFATGFRVCQLDCVTNRVIMNINSSTVFLIYSSMQNESFLNLICCDVNGNRRNTTIFHLDPVYGDNLFNRSIPMDWEVITPNREDSQSTQSF